ncbi:alanine racemase [Inmirania thermothiophila]|uniref:Alanine racemase n=1 Tax=Inmirania thermothiophila TaxID=1750597 RepID=A0A3N1YBX6_9GAMM|nr:alanine racemase [Inmirania thermothiophila]ROR35172.1 alanine racemase [Inmirania thermothiophila]
MSRGARITVDLAAVRHNLARARAAAGPARVLAVVKADAYGHGAVAVARALAGLADGFAVAVVEEAVALREAGLGGPILVLEGFADGEDLEAAARLDLWLALHDAGQVVRLARAALPRPVGVWLKVDTGMHRLGVAPQEAAALWRRLAGLAQVAGVPVLMTHLACADDPADPATARQLACFAEATAGLEAPRSIANSAGLLGFAAARGDWVRPGIMLYGVSPFTDADPARWGLRPAMTLESRLLAVRDHAAGEPVGYGGTWRARRPTRLGVVAIGYGDGYPRHAPNGTPVWVAGRRVPLVGRVSMDMLTVDLTEHPAARPGDRVVLWGPELPVDEVAACAGTIGYELLCRVTGRPPRRWVDEDAGSGS